MKTLDCDTSSDSEETTDSAISRQRIESNWGRLPLGASSAAAPSAWGWHSTPVSVIDTRVCRFVLVVLSLITRC